MRPTLSFTKAVRRCLRLQTKRGLNRPLFLPSRRRGLAGTLVDSIHHSWELDAASVIATARFKVVGSLGAAPSHGTNPVH